MPSSPHIHRLPLGQGRVLTFHPRPGDSGANTQEHVLRLAGVRATWVWEDGGLGAPGSRGPPSLAAAEGHRVGDRAHVFPGSMR